MCAILSHGTEETEKARFPVSPLAYLMRRIHNCRVVQSCRSEPPDEGHLSPDDEA